MTPSRNPSDSEKPSGHKAAMPWNRICISWASDKMGFLRGRLGPAFTSVWGVAQCQWLSFEPEGVDIQRLQRDILGCGFS